MSVNYNAGYTGFDPLAGVRDQLRAQAQRAEASAPQDPVKNLIKTLEIWAEAKRRDQDRQDRLDREAKLDQRFNESQEYRKGRDEVLDQRFNESQEYRKGRDEVLDQRFNESQEYRKGRDEVLDQRFNESQEYRKGRDEVLDQRYETQGQFQQRTLVDDLKRRATTSGVKPEKLAKIEVDWSSKDSVLSAIDQIGELEYEALSRNAEILRTSQDQDARLQAATRLADYYQDLGSDLAKRIQSARKELEDARRNLGEVPPPDPEDPAGQDQFLAARERVAELSARLQSLIDREGQAEEIMIFYREQQGALSGLKTPEKSPRPNNASKASAPVQIDGPLPEPKLSPSKKPAAAPAPLDTPAPPAAQGLEDLQQQSLTLRERLKVLDRMIGPAAVSERLKLAIQLGQIEEQIDALSP